MFYVSKCLKNSTVDNYLHGEDPNTTTIVDLGINGFYNSLEELAEELGLPSGKENWVAYDDGKIYCSVNENESGENILNTKEFNDQMIQFKTGKINFYSCEYHFVVKFVKEMYTPTEEELATKFNIESYD